MRIPLGLFADVVSPDDRVIVLLEHLDYYVHNKRGRSAFGWAAYTLSQAPGPLAEFLAAEEEIPGVSGEARRTALEILESGTAALYEKLVNTRETV